MILICVYIKQYDFTKVHNIFLTANIMQRKVKLSESEVPNCNLQDCQSGTVVQPPWLSEDCRTAFSSVPICSVSASDMRHIKTQNARFCILKRAFWKLTGFVSLRNGIFGRDGYKL